MGRDWSRLWWMLAAAVLATLFAAPQAGAHAVLRATDPSREQLVEGTPQQITLRFSEPVSVAFGAVRVYGPSGERVEGEVEARGREVLIGLDDAGPGSYAASWRVVSADSHPVRGALVFHVDQRSGDDVSLERAQAAAAASPTAQVAAGIARFATLLGVLLATGGAVFAWWIAPGWRPRGVGLALLVVVVGSGAAFVLDAMVAGGLSVVDALRPDVIQEQSASGYGRSALVRGALAVAALTVWWALRRSGPRGRLARIAVTIPFLLMATTLSFAGHAAAADPAWLRIGADVLHVLAAACWVGGLAQLAPMLAGHATARSDVPSIDAVWRFSRVAFAAVAVLVATGVYAAIVEVGSWEALVETTYGRLLLVKLLLFGLTLPLAALNRKVHLPRLREPVDADAGAHPGAARLRRFVLAETAIVLAVVALTAWLVATPPAKDDLQPRIEERQLRFPGEGTAQVTIDPAGTGGSVVHVYVFDAQSRPDGRVRHATLQLLGPEGKIGPLDVELDSAGPGHFTVATMTIPSAGRWRITLIARRGEFEELRRSFHVEVRSGR